MRQSLTNRSPTAGAPSSHEDDNSGRGGRSARGRNNEGGIAELEVQRTGRRTRKDRRTENEGRDHQYNHYQHQRDRGHERGLDGVQSEAGWAGGLNALPHQHQHVLHRTDRALAARLLRGTRTLSDLVKIRGGGTGTGC